MASPIFTTGRAIVTAGNLMYAVGAFIADFNKTHVYNPTWPPHARFHNGQTMSLGVLLASMSLYFAYRPALDKKLSSTAARESMLWSTIIGSFYSLAGLSAIFYPGTDWYDPPLTKDPGQRWLFSGIVVAMGAGYALESSRLGKAKTR
ncbi:hypothetical protein LTR78_005421 [Recurvomyces mirabilis]|uniref:Acetyltransferase n=1 Tax=Recurvomyces mirabilis TaxID=574656 RepID=A0AAE1C1L5_9PEZI|nr:hypothetical protein LTR78_005421 [Recurvomyces mirabilis]KAK5152673.1 hypothetical protein LTS14_008207 [Recurvomyces mirabilis]